MDQDFNAASWNDPTAHDNNPNSYNDFADSEDEFASHGNGGVGSSTGAAYHQQIPGERVITERDYEDYGAQEGGDESGAGLVGTLTTRVGDPTTEGEGTKDAFVSYLVTTDVSGFDLRLFWGGTRDGVR